MAHENAGGGGGGGGGMKRSNVTYHSSLYGRW